MPRPVFTWSTTIGAASEVNSIGTLSNWSFHFNSKVDAFSRLRMVSMRAHPVLCGSAPNVGQSARTPITPSNSATAATRVFISLLSVAREFRRKWNRHRATGCPLGPPHEGGDESRSVDRSHVVAEH